MGEITHFVGFPFLCSKANKLAAEQGSTIVKIKTEDGWSFTFLGEHIEKCIECKELLSPWREIA